MDARIVLKRDREKPVQQRHPWVFSGAIARVEGDAPDGALVQVVDYQGEYLATGTLNRRSQIVARLLTWDAGERVDSGFWRRRLERAIAARRLPPRSNACRLVYAESDGLPGLVVDRYGDWLAVQSLPRQVIFCCFTAGDAERYRRRIGHLARKDEDEHDRPQCRNPRSAGIEHEPPPVRAGSPLSGLSANRNETISPSISLAAHTLPIARRALPEHRSEECFSLVQWDEPDPGPKS